MRYFVLFVLLILAPPLIHAQKHDANWVMCTPNITLKFDELGFEVDSFSLDKRNIGLFNSNASYSNSEGELLMISNGYRVYDRNGALMMGGNSLILSSPELNQADTDTSFGSGTIANPIVLPLNKTEDSLLMIRKSVTGSAHDIYLYVINMNANNGLGQVVTSNVLLAKDMSGSSVGVCKHANGRWWWLVARRLNSNAYIKWLVKDNGVIETIDTQAVGPVLTGFDFLVQNVFSLKGDRFISGNLHDYVVAFNFDRCSGQLIFKDTLLKPALDTNFFSGNTGLQLSASGRYLYVARYLYLHQYDIEAPDVNASAVLLADLDSVKWILAGWPKAISYMQLAPDNRIYIAGYGSPIELSVINNPDSGGLACSLDTFKIAFPDSKRWFGMPTYPHYRTPAAEVWQAGAGSSRTVCDSAIAANGVTLGKPHIPGITYHWSSPNNTTFSSTQPQPVVYPTQTTTYILHLRDTASTYYSCTERFDTLTITVTPVCYTGVSSTSEGQGAWVRLFPNPTADQLTIEAHTNGVFQLYNSIGQLVRTATLQKQTTHTLRLQPLAAGLYHYRFTATSGALQQGKVVKE